MNVRRLTLTVILAGTFWGFAVAAAAPSAGAEGQSAPKLPPELVAKNCYTAVDASFSSINWQSYIHIKSDADVQALRAALIRQIWPDGLPSGTSTVTMAPATTGKSDPNASGLYPIFIGDRNSGLKAEYRSIVDLGNDFRSIVFLWVPKSSNKRLFLVHDGHADSSYQPDGTLRVPAMVNATNYATAKTLLNRGFTVAWFQMPLYGDNLTASNPLPPFPSNCRIGCDRHGAIFRTYNHSGSPYRYFLEPVVVTLNLLLSQANYLDVTMMGASGGGWTTLMDAAIDPRITTSVSVAGSLPMELRTGVCGRPSVGDAEQQNEPGNLYTKISFLDLYIMAANGIQSSDVPRQHIQVNNQYDTCCFFGVTHRTYSDMLESYVNRLKLGRYSCVLNTHFVGHGYDSRTVPPAANNTLNDVVLPAITPGPG